MSTIRFPELDDIEARITAKRAELGRIFAEAKAADGSIDMTRVKCIDGTTAEKLAHVKSLNDELAALTTEAAPLRATKAAAEAGAGSAGFETGDGSARPFPSGAPGAHRPNAFAEALKGAKFDLHHNPRVEVDGYALLEAVKASTLPAVTDWNRAAPVLVPTGRDERWLWPNLVMDRPQTAMSIQDFKQTARTVTGTVQRTLSATSEKATLDVTVSLVNEALAQFAVVIPDIPNALLENVPLFGDFMAQEGRFVVQQAIDTHVLAQIVAASPPFGTTAATPLPDLVRLAVGSMRAVGADPSLVVLNPGDSAGLDTLRTTDGVYINGADSVPMRDVRVVERIGAGNEPPYVIDPAMLGVLYMGPMRFDANPFAKFSRNLTDLRVEVNALFHVRNANGARRIAAS